MPVKHMKRGGSGKFMKQYRKILLILPLKHLFVGAIKDRSGKTLQRFLLSFLFFLILFPATCLAYYPPYFVRMGQCAYCGFQADYFSFESYVIYQEYADYAEGLIAGNIPMRNNMYPEWFVPLRESHRQGLTVPITIRISPYDHHGEWVFDTQKLIIGKYPLTSKDFFSGKIITSEYERNPPQKPVSIPIKAGKSKVPPYKDVEVIVLIPKEYVYPAYTKELLKLGYDGHYKEWRYTVPVYESAWL